jgi:hypothetical protein
MTLPPMPIILGAPRSGTTLLRYMLDAHPDLAIPPETGFLAIAPELTTQDNQRSALWRTVTAYPPQAPTWPDFGIDADSYREALDRIEPFTVADGVRAFYRLYAARFGKPRWGDKTPSYAFHLTSIATLLPEAHFVHIIRDGRDVAMSWRTMWFSPGDEIETLARSWSNFVTVAQDEGAHCPHYIEVFYEELVLNTRMALERVCAFLSLPYDDAMARYFERVPDRLREHGSRYDLEGNLVVSHETRLRQQRNTARPPDPSLVFEWKRSMCEGERSQFEAVAGRQLRTLGYETKY